MLSQGAQMEGLRDTARPYPNPKVEEGKRGLGAEISKDRIRSFRIEVDISGSGNLKTADNIALYPLMVERGAPLRLNI